MKYQQYIQIGIGILIIGLSSSAVYAQDPASITKDQLNTSYPSNLVSQAPTTQAEANAIIDTYINQSFKDIYYTEKSSIGEIKLIVKNKYLFTKQQIDFSAINYNIDKNFKFEGAQYTWKITKGDKVVFERSSIDKATFFYSFAEVGNYQIEISVNAGGVIKTGSINLDIFDKISLDYRPLNPGKGDTIFVATEIPISQYTIEWKVDGKTVDKNKNTISFSENKGYNNSYVVEAIARDKITGYTKYYGVSTIEIKQPEIRVSLVNNKTNTPIDFTDEINITENTPVLISSNLDNLGQDAKVSYSYRINNEAKEGNGNSLTVDIDSNKSYKIDIVAKDTNGDTNIYKSFVINKDKLSGGNSDESIEANIVGQVAGKFKFLKNDRYLGLGVLLISGIIILVMLKHSVLVKEKDE